MKKPTPDMPSPGKTRPAFASRDGRFVLYHGDCLKLMPEFPRESFDMIFADPPYFLSNDGITCHAGRMVSVNKGKWDKSKGLTENYEFTLKWLALCQMLLKPNGTIWVSGTSHIHFIIGFCLAQCGYKILNDIAWVKPNPPPNLSCRYFTHSTEIIWWAARDKKSRHKFNYDLMKELNENKQMKSVWGIDAPKPEEKIFGKHPTQKPIRLLERIIAASTDENDLILDPFSGSSTTGIAAARMNRRFHGVELEREYVEMSVKRYQIEYEVGGSSLFLDFERKQDRSKKTISRNQKAANAAWNFSGSEAN
jgi:site-specific DNA-methyltransferase (adenine-specific)